MAGVEFNEEPQYSAQSHTPDKPALVRFVLRYELAKDDKGAIRFLLWMIGVIIFFIIGIFFLSRKGHVEPQTPQDTAWPKPLRG